MPFKKLFNENNPKNTFVHIVFHRGPFNEELEGVGVLMEERGNSVQVAFSAKNNDMFDYLNIKRSDIISINSMNSSEIKDLKS